MAAHDLQAMLGHFAGVSLSNVLMSLHIKPSDNISTLSNDKSTICMRKTKSFVILSACQTCMERGSSG